MKKDKDYKKVLGSLQKDFGWADTKDMSYMEKDLVNDVIRAVKNLTIPVVSQQRELLIDFVTWQTYSSNLGITIEDRVDIYLKQKGN